MADYGPDTTTDDVLEGMTLDGLHVMITGAASGLGEEAARSLAAHGATVTMVARRPEQVEEAMARIRATVPDADLRAGTCDLADLATVRAFTEHYVAAGDPIDVLMNNAGVMACPLLRTADGFEMQFGTNHLGHFALTQGLMPKILEAVAPRIVNLSSAGHSRSDIDLDDPNHHSTEYDPWVAYGKSKTANILFTRELARRYPDVLSLAVHPGGIMTNLGRHLTEELIADMMATSKARIEEHGDDNGSDDSDDDGGPGFKFKSLEAGAATQVWAAVAPELAEQSGSYLADCRLGVEGANPGTHGYMAYAYDADNAAALWTLSEELVG